MRLQRPRRNPWLAGPDPTGGSALEEPLTPLPSCPGRRGRGSPKGWAGMGRLAPGRALLAGLGLVLLNMGCDEESPELVLFEDEVCFDRPSGRVCVFRYEASRPDATSTSVGSLDFEPRSLPSRLPWTEITWEAAAAACVSKGYRLCEAGEWIDACDGLPGEGGFQYTYGDDVEPSNCIIGTGEALATGSRAGCESALRLFDLSGNVWEWTGTTPQTATARGGSWRSTTFHACTSEDSAGAFPLDLPNVEVGFRCCRNP